jgi:hypothetical protein
MKRNAMELGWGLCLRPDCVVRRFDKMSPAAFCLLDLGADNCQIV